MASDSKGQAPPPPPPPPAGYPTEAPTEAAPAAGKKACCSRTKQRGERGFIEGCLFALCCCWICETCCL